MRLFTDKLQMKRVWDVRESALGATSHVPDEAPGWEGWEDAAVAPEKLGGYLRDLFKIMKGYGYRSALYGHFGHACVHMRINFDLQSKARHSQLSQVRRRSRGFSCQLRRIALR